MFGEKKTPKRDGNGKAHESMSRILTTVGGCHEFCFPCRVEESAVLSLPRLWQGVQKDIPAERTHASTHRKLSPVQVVWKAFLDESLFENSHVNTSR